MGHKAFYKLATVVFTIIGFLVALAGFHYSSFYAVESNQIKLIELINENNISCLTESHPLNETYCNYVERYEEILNITNKNIKLHRDSLFFINQLFPIILIFGALTLSIGFLLDRE